MANNDSKSGLVVLFIIGAIVVALISNIFAGKKTSEKLHYEDQTGTTLQGSTKDKIQKVNENLNKLYGGAELYVAIVKTSGNKSVAKYAKAYFSDKNIGATNDNGLLLLISVAENTYETIYGRGLTDSFAGEIAIVLSKYFAEPFASGDYDTAIANTVPKLASILETECARWYSGNTVATPETTQPEITSEPEYSVDEDVIGKINRVDFISIFALGIGYVIRFVFRLIFGIVSSLSVGVIVVVVILVCIINSGSKNSRKSGGVYFRNVPPSEPFDRGPGSSERDGRNGPGSGRAPSRSTSGRGTGPVSRSSSMNRPGR